MVARVDQTVAGPDHLDESVPDPGLQTSECLRVGCLARNRHHRDVSGASVPPAKTPESESRVARHQDRIA